MELQQIKYFRVIARTENISRAAEQLFIAQPSLSQMLKRLEEEIGMPLFDRNGKKIVLNGAGKIFLKYADEVCQALENAESELREYSGAEIMDVNISVESASLLIPDIIGRIGKAFPRIMPHIFQSCQSDWDLKLDSDVSSLLPESAVQLLEEPIGIVMPKDHILADKAEITKQDLSSCDFISLSPSSNLYQIIAHFCETEKFAPKISMYVESPSIMRDLLKMNMGIAFVPQDTWYRFYHEVLLFKTVWDMPMRRFVRLTCNEQKYQTQAAQSCKNTIIDYFKEYSRKGR